MYHLERQNRLRVFVHVLCPSIERSEKYCFTVSVCLSLKAHLIYTHLLVPRSRSSAKVKVEYQGHISQKLAIWGHYVSQTHLIVLFFFHRDLAAWNCLVSSCNPSTMVVKIGNLEWHAIFTRTITTGRREKDCYQCDGCLQNHLWMACLFTT